MKKYYQHLAWIIGFLAVGCSGHDFQLASDENGFTQSSKTISVPIDILWVIDNSGSMATSQAAIAANVTSFIDKFRNTNFDFQIAVTTTQAYKSQAMFGGVASWSRFRDGRDDTSHTGVFVMNKNTPSLESVFQVNIMQGIDGSADERGFQSLESTLTNVQNVAQFPRVGAFLAVIFITDEEDFSWNGTANIQLDGSGNPNSSSDPRLDPISKTTDFLDVLTNSTSTKKNYNVNTIAIFDQACLAVLSTDFPGRRTADRYAQLTDATGGVKASLCDDFSGILSNLTDSILIQTTKFYLTREPIISTLEIYVNDALYPTSKWDYNAGENSISFHADSIPNKDASIRVKYTPKTLK